MPMGCIRQLLELRTTTTLLPSTEGNYKKMTTYELFTQGFGFANIVDADTLAEAIAKCEKDTGSKFWIGQAVEPNETTGTAAEWIASR